MAEGQVISCHTVETWNEQLQKGKNENKLVSIISFPDYFVSQIQLLLDYLFTCACTLSFSSFYDAYLYVQIPNLVILFWYLYHLCCIVDGDPCHCSGIMIYCIDSFFVFLDPQSFKVVSEL